MQQRKEKGQIVGLTEELEAARQHLAEVERLKKKMHVKRCPAETKIRLLVENYEDLITADKSRKSNRTGNQEICRIKNSKTQSFAMLDAPQFAVGRQIYYEFGRIFRDLNEKVAKGAREGEPAPDDKSKAGASALGASAAGTIRVGDTKSAAARPAAKPSSPSGQ